LKEQKMKSPPQNFETLGAGYKIVGMTLVEVEAGWWAISA
jgi:hypothetical protein